MMEKRGKGMIWEGLRQEGLVGGREARRRNPGEILRKKKRLRGTVFEDRSVPEPPSSRLARDAQ
jgi:hypothetical protein